MKDYMPEFIGVLFFFSTLLAKVGIGDTIDLVDLAPHGMFAVVMILLLRYIPARDQANREQIKLIIKEMRENKEKEIARIVKIYNSKCSSIEDVFKSEEHNQSNKTNIKTL